MNILDVGCGAGFLSESMTRLGGNVIGLDPNLTSYNEAINHKSTKSDLKLL
jgi:2-polyprenyl-3-methyl-5-hydroxy-6-metoxy-1,4-benzoquinol methylase